MPICKKSKKGIVYLALCVDDNLTIEDTEAIEKAITALKKWAGIECHRRITERFVL